MIELLIFGAGAATATVVMLFPLQSARRSIETLQEAKDGLAFDNEALKARVTVLRGDNIAMEAAKNLAADHNTELQRELGRAKADLVAANQQLDKLQPKRGPGGRFAKKANPKTKTKPISCG